jgi:2-polyprenyl-6-methoxyphenol hydroxylase-like FAD-dependent oxidoreductase
MKVLIVGAGMAGPTLAYWLLQAGHEPTLVERAPKLPRGGYLVDFWGAGFDVAERMGIVPELRRRGYVMTEARAVDRDGHRIASFEPSAVMGSTQRYLSIARSDLAAVIYGALQERVELILGDTVSALDDNAERVRVTFESGGTRDFDLVVGADGLHSRLALVGDAAACPSLLAGQGSALAMVEAYVLAAELTRSSDHVEAFARYQERLGDFLRSKQDAAVGLGPAFAPKNRLQLLVQNTVMRLMGLPKVADLAMGKSFHDAVELPAFATA